MAPVTVHDPATSGPGAPGPADTLAIAEALLTRRSGAPVRLADAADLGGSDRSRVLRVRVAENPFSLPRTLVLKHYGVGAVASFRFEAASFQLATALPSEDRVSPTLVANDPEHRLLVLEDLGRCASLADRLHATDPGTGGGASTGGGADGGAAKAAERALLGWARSLGRLQAATAGREDDFRALLRRFGARTWHDPLAEDARAAVAEVPDLLARLLGVRVAPAAVAEAQEATRLLGGGTYRAFSPSEVCPENCLITGGGSRFLDFEWGSFRDVALSAASLRLPFPGCGTVHRLPPGMVEAMTASWQAEVSAVWPELAEPVSGGVRLVQAELLWVWLCTRSLLPGVLGRPDPDQLLVADPGPEAGSVLLAQWTWLARQARAAGVTGTADLAAAVVAALAAHGATELPLFPAFARPEE